MSAAEERGSRKSNNQTPNPNQNSSIPQRQNAGPTAGPGRRGGAGVGGNVGGGRGGNNTNTVQPPSLNSNIPPTNVTSNHATTPTSKTPDSPSLRTQDEHTPLKGFNVQEVQSMLSRGVDTKALVYKPDGQAQTQQQTKPAPWGAKPGAMANGRDFWLELRKQVATLQQTGGVNQGG